MVPFIGATFNIQQHMAKNVHAPLYLCTFHHIMEIDGRAERTQSFFMKANTFIFSTSHMLKLSKCFRLMSYFDLAWQTVFDVISAQD